MGEERREDMQKDKKLEKIKLVFKNYLKNTERLKVRNE